MGRIARIRNLLDEHGIDYYCQSGMPGRRWVLGRLGTFTTAEVENFLDGYTVATLR